jgi:hypothetical protein
MGAWGIGPFDNDGAADWTAELIDAPDRSLNPFRKTRRSVIDRALNRDLREDWAYEEESLAAAETIAAMLGRRRHVLPPEIGGAIGGMGPAPDAWRRAALGVCEHLLSDRSNLHGCWRETEQFAALKDSIVDLQGRLSAS